MASRRSKITIKATQVQGDSTKNCPYCASEQTEYTGYDNTRPDDIKLEEWKCGCCGGKWFRSFDEEEERYKPPEDY